MAKCYSRAMFTAMLIGGTDENGKYVVSVRLVPNEVPESDTHTYTLEQAYAVCDDFNARIEKIPIWWTIGKIPEGTDFKVKS